MYICYLLLCEYIEDGMVKLKFVKWKKMMQICLTLPGNLFEKHVKNLVWNYEEVGVEVQQEGC